MNKFKNKSVTLLLMLIFASLSFATDHLSIVNNPFLYSAAYKDKESYLQYLNARYYNADIRRFISRDSYALPNRYNYAGDNPIMNDDPSGHLTHLELGIIIGVSAVALISLGVNGYLVLRNRILTGDVDFVSAQLDAQRQALLPHQPVSDFGDELASIRQEMDRFKEIAQTVEAENNRLAAENQSLRAPIQTGRELIRRLLEQNQALRNENALLIAQRNAMLENGLQDYDGGDRM